MTETKGDRALARTRALMLAGSGIFESAAQAASEFASSTDDQIALTKELCHALADLSFLKTDIKGG